ncbi:hypothetical protein EVG20_g6411 [Dentipellis fragilis]|uniref:Snurportin-1 n=1 Tax=Dentipellis fragilis TaxID=205917 RepID=A0A4Y9YLA4_9AGAM|nr:hypothetical protein EVG20_g6411 [Dentipellis fragilis]
MADRVAFADRKASFKQPPGHVTDRSQSQAARRNKALEEQKRRRAKRIESERHIDLLAGLSLEASDDEADEVDERPQPLGHFASLLKPSALTTDSTSNNQNAAATPMDDMEVLPTSFKSKTKRRRRPKAQEKAAKKPSPWADKCMYAELLEMTDLDSVQWTADGSVEIDRLPEDLQTGWVAVAPVPVGKRCLAVSHQGSGTIGVVPNTTLRSRVLGKPLMPRFPSPLPSDTIIDCILDQNWQQNGILHVLDVLKWKGQDVADCETSFRLWWRDTRLSELPPPRPPTGGASNTEYRFPYPTAFIPVRYHTNTTLPRLLTHVIPLARSSYNVNISIPTNPSADLRPAEAESEMEIEESQPSLPESSVKEINAEIKSDGLLLYVAQAIYEPGTSPLSSWIPVATVQDETAMMEGHTSPLDTFQRLVQKRLAREQATGGQSDTSMQT